MTPGLTRIQTAEKAIADFLEAAPLGNVLQISSVNITGFIEKTATEFQVYVSGASRQQTFKTASDLMCLELGEAFLDGTLQDSQTQEPLKNLLREKEMSQIDAQPTPQMIDQQLKQIAADNATERIQAEEIDPDDIFDLDPDEAIVEEAAEAIANTPEPAIAVELEEQPKPPVKAQTTPVTPTAKPEPETKIAQLKLFGNSSGAMVFGDAAADIAETLGLEVETGETGSRLKLASSQFESAISGLEAKDWTVEMVQPKQATRIALHGNNATVYGEGASHVAEKLGLTTEATEKGTAKLKIPMERVEEVTALLKQGGFKADPKEVASNRAPKAVFREHPDGETYSVFDGSARNVAKALEKEPDQTAGGRPVLKFSREEYKEVKQTLKDQGFELSLKDLELKAKIATFTQDNGTIGGVITGEAAREAAAALNLETGWTKQGGNSNTSQPKLILRGVEQVDAAKKALEAQNYTIEVTELPSMQIANMSTFQDGSAALFGEPAKLAAEHLGVKTIPTRNGNVMVKVEANEIPTAKAMLTEKGYEIRSQPYTPPPSKTQAPQTQSAAAKPKVKAGEGR